MLPPNFQVSAILRSLRAGVALFCLGMASVQTRAAGVLKLDFAVGGEGAGLAVGDAFDGGSNGELTLKRLDFLLSGLALQRTDGTWLESRDWTEFISVGKQKLTAESNGVEAGEYQAIRFRVGVDPRTDQTDPAIYAPDHPLHPDVCGLHWSWQGGYIYMAVEGNTARKVAGADGFSLHLAREGNAPFVELPVKFRGGGPVTISLDLDVSAILEGIDFARDGNSTHSRDGDPIPLKMKRNLVSAFKVRSVKNDVYQTAPEAIAGTMAPIPPGTHPYPFQVSSHLPKVSLPTDNPLTNEGVLLGSRLFHDTRLSVNNSQSCSSCHQKDTGLSDARRFSIGAMGHEGKRRSMPLVNLAWQKHFFWDGRAPRLRDQVLMPIKDPHEMNETPENVVRKLSVDPAYKKDFKSAFGSPGITVERMALALEQFLLTRISQQSRFDQALKKSGELTETEKRGLQLFVTEHAPERGLRGADCFHCHGGMLFTNHEFHDNGLPLTDDKGRMDVTGNPADLGKFKTPSLRNVALRAPYMHDGSLATLEEVVEHYNSGVQRRPNLDPNLAKHPVGGLGLTDQEKRELVAFLRTLTDESFTAPPSSPKDSPQ
jgi:cytochrome c peroxidase